MELEVVRVERQVQPLVELNRQVARVVRQVLPLEQVLGLADLKADVVEGLVIWGEVQEM